MYLECVKCRVYSFTSHIHFASHNLTLLFFMFNCFFFFSSLLASKRTEYTFCVYMLFVYVCLFVFFINLYQTNTMNVMCIRWTFRFYLLSTPYWPTIFFPFLRLHIQLFCYHRRDVFFGSFFLYDFGIYSIYIYVVWLVVPLEFSSNRST